MQNVRFQQRFSCTLPASCPPSPSGSSTTKTQVNTLFNCRQKEPFKYNIQRQLTNFVICLNRSYWLQYLIFSEAYFKFLIKISVFNAFTGLYAFLPFSSPFFDYTLIYFFPRPPRYNIQHCLSSNYFSKIRLEQWIRVYKYY